MKTTAFQLLLTAALLGGVSAYGVERTKPMSSEKGQLEQPRNAPAASTEHQFSGKITEVNRANKTITIEDKQFGRETLHISAETRLLKGKETASWDQLKDGEEVRATARKSGEMNHALSVEIGK